MIQLPLFGLAFLQMLLTIFLLTPRPIALTVAQLIRMTRKNTVLNTVILTTAVGLAGLGFSSMWELFNQKGSLAKHTDAKEMVSTVDYLRAQVTGCLCALNLALLMCGRALSDALCAEEHSKKNMDAFQRQVKGLQTEYERVTKGDSASGAKSLGSADMTPLEDTPSETEALKKQLDRLIAEKDAMQVTMEAAAKAKATAEASVVAMQSQLKGFDNHIDRVLEENQHLKRKLVGHGDQTYTAEVTHSLQNGKKME